MAAVTASDVAKYLIEKAARGIPQIKLQKLLYYCQVASLVWDDAPLFDDRIEAWISGPVVVDFWRRHKTDAWIRSVADGDTTRLTNAARETIDAVWMHYGKYTPEQLVELAHRDEPWKQARDKARSDERPSVQITDDVMREAYSKAWN